MRLVIAGLAFALCACDGQAAQPPANAPVAAPKLALTGRVIDAANIMSPGAEAEITAQLQRLEHDTTDQLVVVTVQSLDGIPMKKFATDLGNSWGIGRDDWDNGVLLVVAPNERKVRIATGYGVEGLLTDEWAAAIIENMLPHFRKGRLADGIRVGVDEIADVLRSDRRRPQRRTVKEAA